MRSIRTETVSTLRHYPLGDPINGSPHSVCVSLPTMADIIGYEQKLPEIRNRMRSGYPRFFENPLLTRLRLLWKQRLALSGHEELHLLPGMDEFHEWQHFHGQVDNRLVETGAGIGVILPVADEEASRRMREFQQHTGAMLSSREAESHLVREEMIATAHAETRFTGNPIAADLHIRQHLNQVYRTSSEDDILLYRGGMSAFFAGFRALQQLQQARGKDIWIQLGWLYVDTIRILDKWRQSSVPCEQHHDVFDLDGLERLMDSHGDRIAGIVTEVPTNPLLQTTDVPRLREICDRRGAALLLDPTMASPHNVQILPFSDLHINSLTKYAGHAGDTMLGALGLNSRSAFYGELRDRLHDRHRLPPAPDLCRMAHLVDRYGEVVRRVNENTPVVAEFLESHPAIRKIWWAEEDESKNNYNAIRQTGGGVGAMITFELNSPPEHFYDRLRMAKSPSFGTAFSMICPFLYLAHYDLVSTAAGRDSLKKVHMPPELMRLSVGTESAADIIGVLGDALTS